MLVFRRDYWGNLFPATGSFGGCLDNDIKPELPETGDTASQ